MVNEALTSDSKYPRAVFNDYLKRVTGNDAKVHAFEVVSMPLGQQLLRLSIDMAGSTRVLTELPVDFEIEDAESVSAKITDVLGENVIQDIVELRKKLRKALLVNPEPTVTDSANDDAPADLDAPPAESQPDEEKAKGEITEPPTEEQLPIIDAATTLVFDGICRLLCEAPRYYVRKLIQGPSSGIRPVQWPRTFILLFTVARHDLPIAEIGLEPDPKQFAEQCGAVVARMQQIAQEEGFAEGTPAMPIQLPESVAQEAESISQFWDSFLTWFAVDDVKFFIRWQTGSSGADSPTPAKDARPSSKQAPKKVEKGKPKSASKSAKDKKKADATPIQVHEAEPYVDSTTRLNQKMYGEMPATELISQYVDVLKTCRVGTMVNCTDEGDLISINSIANAVADLGSIHVTLPFEKPLAESETIMDGEAEVTFTAPDSTKVTVVSRDVVSMGSNVADVLEIDRTTKHVFILHAGSAELAIATDLETCRVDGDAALREVMLAYSRLQVEGMLELPIM
ncbi:hypothetical protein J8273_2117 [Carpediemonas membranifera]|uniref:Uncharacterized protein n=1 Tax=Carpediemonas membranifera TaxID=201153 RepID=A0A8J6E438_9EUKA|nr:hypothetical protein J8273_2117 [Carpediemonas membranifera]|eukprot:KAG9396386.1 hypothetical protein J8273_2117 [Carpediemonas membranifera]